MSASAVSPPGTPRLPGDPASRPSIDTLYLADAMMEAAGQKPHLRLYPYLLGVNRIGTTAVAANATVSEPVPVGGDANFMAMGLLGQVPKLRQRSGTIRAERSRRPRTAYATHEPRADSQRSEPLLRSLTP